MKLSVLHLNLHYDEPGLHGVDGIRQIDLRGCLGVFPGPHSWGFKHKDKGYGAHVAG